MREKYSVTQGIHNSASERQNICENNEYLEYDIQYFLKVLFC